MTLSYYGFVLVALLLQMLMGTSSGATLLGSVIATNVVRPIWAVLLLFLSMIVAPLTLGSSVVTTLGTKIIPLSSIRMEMLYGTVIATILWVGIARGIRCPVSISYTFVGALVGSGMAMGLAKKLNRASILGVFGGMFLAIIVGFVVGFLILKLIDLLMARATPHANRGFKVLQVISSIALIVGYGANDGTKVLSLLYMASAVLGRSSAHITIFSTALLAVVFIFGNLFFGAGIAQTSGYRLMKSSPKTVSLAQTVTSVIVLGASALGIPVSSTETLSMAMIGTGVGERPGSVRWNVVIQLLLTWLITIPASMMISWMVTAGITALFH